MNTLLNMDFKKVEGKLLHFPPQNSDDLRPLMTSDDLRPLRAFQGREGETPRRSSPHPGASRPEIIKCVNLLFILSNFPTYTNTLIDTLTDRLTYYYNSHL